MNPILIAVIVSACLFGAVLLGRRLRGLLPEHHLSEDTKDTVKLAMGLVATMTALLLGLLVSSAKGSYDTTRGEVIQMAAKVSYLDGLLAAYGPDAAEARVQFRAAIEGAVRRMWPGEGGGPAQLTPDTRVGDALYAAIQRLSPRDDTQSGLKAQAVGLAVEIRQLRYLLLAQSVSSISQPLLVAVVCLARGHFPELRRARAAQRHRHRRLDGLGPFGLGCHFVDHGIRPALWRPGPDSQRADT